MPSLALAIVPRLPLWLGVAGLIPFVAGLVGVVAPRLAIGGPLGLLVYGAVILSFMGGVHWGLAITVQPPRPAQLVISVLPALLAWVAVLAGDWLGMLVEAAGFAALLAYDVSATSTGAAPAWYSALRVRLTAGAVLCLVLGAAAA